MATERGVILYDETAMRKIPDERASGWRSLVAGTSVAVQGLSDGFILVETGYGLKGWVASERILFDAKVDAELNDTSGENG